MLVSYNYIGDYVKKILVLLIMLIPLNVKAFNSSAKSAILMDMDSHRIIYGKDINYTQSVASISKIMTAISVIENTNIEKEIVVGDEILKAYGSGIYVKQGEKLKIKDLLYGLMMRSGNDAALVLAKNTSGSIEDFVKLMNENAKKIGMKNTTFNNPSGLDEEKGNISSSYDMALLMSYAMKNKQFRKIVSTKEYTLKTDKNVYKWRNKNKLLYSYKYTTGGKTGFTKIAKRTLVTSASKNGLNLTIVTINDGNDFKDHENLYEEAFKNYTNYTILNKGKLSIIGENYYKNNELYIKNNLTYPLTENEQYIVKLKYEIKKIRKYKNNDKVGEVKLFLGDELVNKENVYLKVRHDK